MCMLSKDLSKDDLPELAAVDEPKVSILCILCPFCHQFSEVSGVWLALRTCFHAVIFKAVCTLNYLTV